MRFAVGDKVLVRNDLEVGREYDEIGFVAPMAKFKGKVLTISVVKREVCYNAEESGTWNWTEEMFVLPERMNEAQRALMDASKSDPVSHPSHYTYGKIEVIDFIQDKQLDFCRGNIVKYVSRAGKKGDKSKELEDLKKARQYCDFAIAALEEAE